MKAETIVLHTDRRILCTLINALCTLINWNDNHVPKSTSKKKNKVPKFTKKNI